jgi:hypothetical protein
MTTDIEKTMLICQMNGCKVKNPEYGAGDHHNCLCEEHSVYFREYHDTYKAYELHSDTIFEAYKMRVRVSQLCPYIFDNGHQTYIRVLEKRLIKSEELSHDMVFLRCICGTICGVLTGVKSDGNLCERCIEEVKPLNLSLAEYSSLNMNVWDNPIIQLEYNTGLKKWVLTDGSMIYPVDTEWSTIVCKREETDTQLVYHGGEWASW